MASTPMVGLFLCASCGHASVRWAMTCPECRRHNSFRRARVPESWGAAKLGTAPTAGRGGATSLRAVTEAPVVRYSSGMPDVDRVLSAAGGAAPRSAVLLGGDPGVGKTTLLLQLLEGFSAYGPVLYVSAEEGSEQIGESARRVVRVIPEHFYFMTEKNIDAALVAVESIAPVAVVFDSVNRGHTSKLDSTAGSLPQARYVTKACVEKCKARGFVLFLIAHITKEGDLAGPKDVEHDVDTVLYFERVSETVRRLHVAKNRLGSEAETATLNMTSSGLVRIGA